MPLTATAAEADGTIARSIDELRLLWRKARETFNATIIQQSFLDITEPVFGSYDRLVPGAPARVVTNSTTSCRRLRHRIAFCSWTSPAPVSATELIAWFDTRSWLQGKLEIAPQAATLYGDMVARIVAAQRGLSKKCLVFDLDNTSGVA